MHSIGPSLTPTPDPIAFGAAGAPYLYYRHAAVEPEPFVDVRVEMGVSHRGQYANLAPWKDCGDYRWSRLSNESESIMGLHLTQRTVDVGLVECALHVPNAVCDPRKLGSFCGSVGYDFFAITPPPGWNIAHEFPIGDVRGNGSGPHFWPSLAARTFRFVLYREPGQRQAAARVLRCEHVSFDAPIPMGPQRTTIAPGEGSWQDALRVRMVGPWRLSGEPTPWAHGGTGIAPLHCMPLSSQNALMHRRLADASAARGLCVAYHADDGHPIMPQEWGEPPGWEYLQERGLPFNQRNPHFIAGRTDDYAHAGQATMTSKNARITSAGQFFADKRFNAPNGCPYEWELRQWYAPDAAHFTRQYQDDATIAVLLDDTIAKLRLTAYAADVMTSWALQHSPGLWPGAFSLEKALSGAKANPHRGGRIPRIQAWSYHAVASALMFMRPDTRERAFSIWWAGKALEYAVTSATPTYLPQNGGPGSDDSIPWDVYGLARDKCECPLFQVPMWASGVYALAITAHGRRTSALVKELVLGSARALYGDPSKFVVGEYDPRTRGPHWYVVTSSAGAMASTTHEGVGRSHPIHLWHHLALAMSWAPDAPSRREFLSMALTVNYPSTNARELAAKLNPTNPWDQHMAAVLAEEGP